MKTYVKYIQGEWLKEVKVQANSVEEAEEKINKIAAKHCRSMQKRLGKNGNYDRFDDTENRAEPIN